MSKSDEEKAIDIFGREEYNKMIEDGRSILDYIMTSGGGVEYAPDHCEKCNKKFRLWRKMNITLVNSRFYHVCGECMK